MLGVYCSRCGNSGSYQTARHQHVCKGSCAQAEAVSRLQLVRYLP
jgi:hypothetical protein